MFGLWLEGCQVEPQYGFINSDEPGHGQGAIEQGSHLHLLQQAAEEPSWSGNVLRT